MSEYYIKKTVNGPDWSCIPSVSLEHTGWLKANQVTAEARACHDDDNLYIRMTAQEKNIRAVITDPLDYVCKDSCLEFFFAPLSDDIRYFNFEFNPLGTMYLGFGGPRMTRIRQMPFYKEKFQLHPFYTETGWGITFAIPLEFITMYFPEFSFRSISACNFYKCGDKTVSPHYLAWNRLQCTEPDFHRREDFGRITFE